MVLNPGEALRLNHEESAAFDMLEERIDEALSRGPSQGKWPIVVTSTGLDNWKIRRAVRDLYCTAGWTVKEGPAQGRRVYFAFTPKHAY